MINAKQVKGIMTLAGHIARTTLSENHLPYKAEFLLTERCNSKCLTCTCWKRDQSGDGELSRLAVTRAVASISDSLKWVGLSGGEPGLRDDLADIASDVAAACPKLVLMNVGSNGLLPERIERHARRIAKLKIPFIMFALSMDGTREVHDKVRGIKGGFDRLIETADRLIPLERKYPAFSLSFQTTLSRYNCDNVEQIKRFLKLRYPDHAHIVTVATDGYAVAREVGPEIKASGTEFEALNKLARSAGVKSLLDILPKAYLGQSLGFLKTDKSPVSCVAGKDMVLIDSRGNVRICDYIKESLGNLADFDYSLKSILQDVDNVARIKSFSNCRQCFSPCQAYPSLIRSPHKILEGLFLSLAKR